MIYLDNAASSWPKPDAVQEAVSWWIGSNGANPGRSNHRHAQAAGQVVRETRAALATLLDAPHPSSIVFTSGATHALNLAIHGVLREGDHVVTTVLEHNSVLRPLHALQTRMGVHLSILEPDETGRIDPATVAAKVTPSTRLVAITHASNVIGTLQPIADVVGAVRAAGGDDTLILVDAAQTAGTVPFSVRNWGADLVACAGHKALFGLQGTGALYVRPGTDVRPLLTGGTGSQSHEAVQPTCMPDCLEAGTPNTPGLVALREGIRYIASAGIDALREREAAVRIRIDHDLRSINGVTVFPDAPPTEATTAIAFLIDDVAPGEAAFYYDQRYDVAIRAGLHCAPWTHRWLGTLDADPQGTLRVSPGPFTTDDEIDQFVDATRELVRHLRRSGERPVRR